MSISASVLCGLMPDTTGQARSAPYGGEVTAPIDNSVGGTQIVEFSVLSLPDLGVTPGAKTTSSQEIAAVDSSAAGVFAYHKLAVGDKFKIDFNQAAGVNGISIWLYNSASASAANTFNDVDALTSTGIHIFDGAISSGKWYGTIRINNAIDVNTYMQQGTVDFEYLATNQLDVTLFDGVKRHLDMTPMPYDALLILYYNNDQSYNPLEPLLINPVA